MSPLNISDPQDKVKSLHFISKFKKHFVVLALLIIQNVTIFWQHYFFDAGFPWDFNYIHYGLPAFLTTAWSLGIFPEWIPFQSMGYPLAMMPLNNFYPAFWAFPLFGIQFTMHAAVITQTIHVLFGTFGMYFLLHALLKSPKYAFIGALAFQFFGGFYSNAEHETIIRVFALGPWLFYVFYYGFKEKIPKRVFFIPIVIFLLATGSSAHFLPGIFIMAIFVISQLIQSLLKGLGRKKLVFMSLFLLLLILLGIAMAMVNLGPFNQEKDSISRFGNFEKLPTQGLLSEILPSLFLSNRPITIADTGVDISMSSFFVTLPIVILASFLPISKLKKYLIFFVPFTVAILMVPGDKSPFYEFITSLFPYLGLNRFPTAEYRIFITIPIIIFGILSLKTIIEKKPSWKFILIRSVFVGIWFVTGITMLYSEVMNLQVILAISILFFTILAIIYYSKIIKFKKNFSNLHLKKKILIPMVIFAILISVDGSGVISDISFTWIRPSITADYAERYVNLIEDGRLITFKIFENLPSERPEREITPKPWQFGWKGYLTGKYMMEDTIPGAILLQNHVIMKNDNYTQYMFMKWTPILVDPNSIQIDNDRISLSKETFADLKSSDRDHIKQTYYGINDITYKISLSKPMLLVENEIFFPGWKATLIYPDKEVEIDALITNKAFRSWLLPSGDYEMKAYFQFPNFILYKIISIFAFVIWISIIVIYWRKNKKHPNTLIKN